MYRRKKIGITFLRSLGRCLIQSNLIWTDTYYVPVAFCPRKLIGLYYVHGTPKKFTGKIGAFFRYRRPLLKANCKHHSPRETLIAISIYRMLGNAGLRFFFRVCLPCVLVSVTVLQSSPLCWWVVPANLDLEPGQTKASTYRNIVNETAVENLLNYILEPDRILQDCLSNRMYLPVFLEFSLIIITFGILRSLQGLIC